MRGAIRLEPTLRDEFIECRDDGITVNTDVASEFAGAWDPVSRPKPPTANLRSKGQNQLLR